MDQRNWFRVLAGVFVAVALVTAWLIYQALPPSHLVLLAGGPTTSYADFAARYREELSHHGVTLEIRNTGGSLANLEALRDPAHGADLALTVTGLASQSDSHTLHSLGGVSRGALWIVYRYPKPLDRVSDLKGLRISTGAPGSSINASVRGILAEGGALGDPSLSVQLSESDAIAALAGGAIDVVFMTGLPQSQAIRKALHLPGVRLMNIAQAGAIALRDKSLSAVVLPRGAIDLQADLPAADVNLLAASSSLIARKDLHPALQYLMLEVAKNVHREPDVFQRYGEFPAPQARDLPLSPYAERFYKNGRPLLFDYLPFWAAAFADRAIWIGVPFLALLISVFQFATPLYYWFSGRHLRACMDELRKIGHEIHASAGAARGGDYKHRLDQIERTVRTLSLSVPEALAAKVLEARYMIDYIRRDFDHAPANPPAG